MHCGIRSDDFFPVQANVPSRVEETSIHLTDICHTPHVHHVPNPWALHPEFSEVTGSVLYPWGSQPGDKASPPPLFLSGLVCERGE